MNHILEKIILYMQTIYYMYEDKIHYFAYKNMTFLALLKQRKQKTSMYSGLSTVHNALY